MTVSKGHNVSLVKYYHENLGVSMSLHLLQIEGKGAEDQQFCHRKWWPRKAVLF